MADGGGGGGDVTVALDGEVIERDMRGGWVVMIHPGAGSGSELDLTKAGSMCVGRGVA